MSEKCIELHEAIKKASIALIEQTKVDYPVGCRVKVQMGRATVIGPVISHVKCWWGGDAGNFNVRNEKTNIIRTVRPHLDYSNIKILKDAE